jgi:hypothetical protein
MAVKPYNFADPLTSTTWQLLLSVDRFGTIDNTRGDHFLFSNEIRVFYSCESLPVFTFIPDNSQTEIEQRYSFATSFNAVVGNQIELGLKVGNGAILQIGEIELKNSGLKSIRDCLDAMTSLNIWFCGQGTELYMRLGADLGLGDFVTVCGCGTIELSSDSQLVVYSP